MLPFLKNKKDSGIATGVIVKTREPDKSEENQEDSHSEAIHACAQEIISAVHSHDAKALAEALKDTFEILESLPHEESGEPEPHSYDSQKEE